jgi:glycosyltransferase involved in cell wall biosynthesis
MTLLIDATTAEHATGIGVVIRGVLSEAPGLQPVGTIIATGPRMTVPRGLTARTVRMAGTRPGRLLYQRALLPLDALPLVGKPGVDRILALDSYAPVITLGRRVEYAALVHDVLPLTHPAYWSLSQRFAKTVAFNSLRRARATAFTSTDHTAAEIERLLGLDARVIRFGCGQLADAEADAARVAPLPERRSYLLYVGAIEARKGTLSLIDIFEAVAGPADLDLVLVGTGRDSYSKMVAARIAASPSRGRIRLIERASREEAIDLLRHATALVFPTLAEGFGLPIIEALALGTPVVASRIDSIRSWAGRAIRYADPNDVREWTMGIHDTLDADETSRRAGQELAADYRWRSCTEGLLSF